MRRLRKRKTNGEAEAAVKDAIAHVREVQARGAEVNEVVADLREIREKNHFAEQLYALMQHRRLEGRM